MRKVRRYTFEVKEGPQEAHLPIHSTIVHVGSKHDGYIDIWFEFDSDSTVDVLRLFEVFGTDHDIPSDAQYCGTSVQKEFVWHLYERMVNGDGHDSGSSSPVS